MRVLVTGAAGCLGQALLPLLCAEADIDTVTGTDLRETVWAHKKYGHRRTDLRHADATRELAEYDAVIHLAYVVLKGRQSASAMRAVNVDASATFLRAAVDAGVPRIIHLSSAAVYGSAELADESQPFDPLPDFLYGQHKAALEQSLAGFSDQIVVLRPHVILGRHAQPTLRQLLRLPVCLRLPDPQPQLQCVHECDVATAILAALRSQATGPFNLAHPDTYNMQQLSHQLHRHVLAVPPAVAAAALHAVNGLTGWGGEPGWLAGLQKTLTLDCQRAQTLLNWSASTSLDDTLMDTLGQRTSRSKPHSDSTR